MASATFPDRALSSARHFVPWRPLVAKTGTPAAPAEGPFGCWHDY